MNLLTPEGRLDKGTLPDGDIQFIGVDERLEPQQLAPGYVSSAKNYRFRRGKIEPRDGITILPWCKDDGLTPFTEVYGAFVYQDPNQGGEWIIIAADGGVWKTRPNSVAKPMTLPTGVTLSRDTFKLFIQANSAIILLRGLTAQPLACYDLATGFQTIEQENQWEVQMASATNRVQFVASNVLIGDPVQFAVRPPPLVPNPDYTYTLPPGIVAGKTYYVVSTPNVNEFTISATPGGTPVVWNSGDTDTTLYDVTITILDGAVPIPPAVDGIFALNRLFLVIGKDLIAVSDIGDFTRYVPQLDVFRINEGDSYTIQKIYLFNEDTLVIFKDGNVSKVTGLTSDLNGARGPLNVTQAYGMAAPAVADFGKDLYWLNSELRIAKLDLTSLNQEQANIEVLSDPMLRTFGRINAGYLERPRLTVFNSFLFTALPFDDANLLDTTNVTEGLIYPDSSPLSLVISPPLQNGVLYQWLAGDNDGYVLNGPGTEFINGDCIFTAVPIVGLAPNPALTTFPAPVTAQFYQVLAQGINTGIAVYDFLPQAWAGTDEATGITHVVDWLKFTYAGKPVLAFIGADGFLHTYEANAYEDDLMQPQTPYVDVLVTPNPAGSFGPQETVQVNGGTTVTVIGQNTTNTSTTWGINQPDPTVNLWQDVNGQGGYNPTSTSPWTAPNTTPSQIANGVRFLATNGITPEIKIAGQIITAPVYFNDSAGFSGNTYYLDFHGANEIQSTPILTDVVLRGFLCKPSYGPADVRRYVAMALQLQTWSPGYVLYTRLQGENDETQYAPDPQTGGTITRDYTKYFSPHTADDWAVDNRNDDFHAPRRQDYAYPETGEGIFLKSGVDFDAEQQFVHRVPISENGLFLQVRLKNTTGRVSILAATLESQDAQLLSGLELN